MREQIAGTKRCPKCERTLLVEEFTRNKNYSDGLSCWCRQCQLNYRLKNKKRFREYAHQYRQQYPERVTACRTKWRQQLKKKILSHYSNGIPHCMGCGITDIDVLCLDHIANNGNEQRRQLGLLGASFYRWLEREGYPEGYQVLCANCNMKKALAGITLSRKDILSGIYEEIEKVETEETREEPAYYRAWEDCQQAILKALEV